MTSNSVYLRGVVISVLAHIGGEGLLAVDEVARPCVQYVQVASQLADLVMLEAL